jgi:hypothetical protein
LPVASQLDVTEGSFALSLKGIVDLHTGVIATGENSLKFLLHRPAE